MFGVNEEVKRQFYKSFGRTEKSVNEDVETIKNWMKTQPHLPELMEDVKIKNFLNMNKFSVEKTKQKIDMYYTMRSLIPDMFLNPKLESMQFAAKNLYACTHPTVLNGDSRVYFVAYKDLMVAKEPMLFFLCIYEMRLYEDFMMNDVFVIDLKRVQFSHLKVFTPSLAKKIFTIYQKIYSIRMKKLYFINSPPFVSTIVSIMKPLIKPKLIDRFEIHEDASVLKELFCVEDLPKDYGGQGPSLQKLMDQTREKLQDYQNRFDLLDELKVKENLRPARINNDDILGFYGNFKKLDVD